MKKLFTLALSLMVAMMMSVPVFAETEGNGSENDQNIAAEEYLQADPVINAMEDPQQSDTPTDPSDPSNPPEEPTTQPTTTPATQPAKPASSTISAQAALNIALKNAGLSKSKVMHIEVDLEKGKYEVEFDRKSNKAEYEYEILQSNGKIVKKSVDYKYKKTKSKKKIGKKKARKAVAKFSKIPYKAVKSGTCKFDKEKRGSKYEIKFRYKGVKYEYEVLARNGKIIEYGWKR